MHEGMGRTLLDLCPLPLPNAWPTGVGQDSAAHLGEGVQHAIPLDSRSAKQVQMLEPNRDYYIVCQAHALQALEAEGTYVQPSSIAVLQGCHARQYICITRLHGGVRCKGTVQHDVADNDQSASITEAAVPMFLLFQLCGASQQAALRMHTRASMLRETK